MSETIIKTDKAVIRQQKITILKDVSLEIKSGEFIYIIGKVGSGKSSFLKTLYAELPLEYGNIEVAGFQLKKIKKSQIPLLRRKCGIVFQDFRLLTDRNVHDNLAFVLKATGWKNRKAIEERIDTVLEKVEMPDKKFKMPHELSGGEQQRIVLARALLNAPPLILADEPTGNIDPETSYRLAELLKDLCENGKTVIIATHQYDLLQKYPGRVLRCENGTLIEDEKLSVQQHTLAPADIESIENTPIEGDILTAPAPEEPSAVLPEEEEKLPEQEKIPEQEADMPEETAIVAENTLTSEEISEIRKDNILPEDNSQSLREKDTAEKTEEQHTPADDSTVSPKEEKKEEKDKTLSSPFGFELID
ncbi:ATP-binding cassette domain-containing protein [Odoribacter sp. OF09-27XD]|jgi:cell division transport system ATP-binding protein|nr:ATP-binding cassette domain-containing protein [Odoribacter sp. OF09-27XD]